MIPFPIPWKLLGIGVVAAFIGYLMWREHSLVGKLAVSRQAEALANANLVAEREARAHEAKISKDATDDYEQRLQHLAEDRAATPVRSVRLCRSPTGYVPAPAAAASGIDDASDAGHAEAAGSHPRDRWSDDGPDIGPPLYALADSKDVDLAKCSALQSWVRSR